MVPFLKALNFKFQLFDSECFILKILYFEGSLNLCIPKLLHFKSFKFMCYNFELFDFMQYFKNSMSHSFVIFYSVHDNKYKVIFKEIFFSGLKIG